MRVNHRPVVKRPPVVLVCEECGHEGCKAEQIESAYWWGRITCPACGHIQMIGFKGGREDARPKDQEEESYPCD